MILSPHYKLSGSTMVNMDGGCYPNIYHTTYPNRFSADLLLYIIHENFIINYSSEKFIKTIEQDIYKLRKIYESNKKY